MSYNVCQPKWPLAIFVRIGHVRLQNKNPSTNTVCGEVAAQVIGCVGLVFCPESLRLTEALPPRRRRVADVRGDFSRCAHVCGADQKWCIMSGPVTPPPRMARRLT